MFLSLWSSAITTRPRSRTSGNCSRSSPMAKMACFSRTAMRTSSMLAARTIFSGLSACTGLSTAGAWSRNPLGPRAGGASASGSSLADPSILWTSKNLGPSETLHTCRGSRRVQFNFDILFYEECSGVKVFIKTIASGVDFLGWVHFSDHRVLRTATKRRMLRRIANHPTQETLASYRGFLSHGNTSKLQKELDRYDAS